MSINWSSSSRSASIIAHSRSRSARSSVSVSISRRNACGRSACAVHAKCRRRVRDGWPKLTDAFGHAVHGVGQRANSWVRAAGERPSKSPSPRSRAVWRRASRSRQTGRHPEPEGDGENDADQAPGQQAQTQFERQPVLSSVAIGGQRANHQHLAGLPEAVVHHVAVVVDGDVAGIQFDDLFRGQYRSREMPFDDVQLKGRTSRRSGFFASRAGMAEQFIFDQRSYRA